MEFLKVKQAFLEMLKICIKWPITLISIQMALSRDYCVFQTLAKISEYCFSKFTRTVDISYSIENIKAKISNVRDDKHLTIKMSTSRSRAKRQSIDYSFNDMVFPARKGALDTGQVFYLIKW